MGPGASRGKIEMKGSLNGGQEIIMGPKFCTLSFCHRKGYIYAWHGTLF